MRAVCTGAVACFVFLAVFHPLAAQEAAQAPLSAEAFQKLKQRALQEPKAITIPPQAKTALRLAETASAVECKQLVAGDLTKRYFFIVTTSKDSDDVFLSTQNSTGDVHMFLTNSKLELRNAVTGARGKNLSPVTNVQAVAGEFNEMLAIWAQVAAGI
jgi:hypothetical protein